MSTDNCDNDRPPSTPASPAYSSFGLDNLSDISSLPSDQEFDGDYEFIDSASSQGAHSEDRAASDGESEDGDWEKASQLLKSDKTLSASVSSFDDFDNETTPTTSFMAQRKSMLASQQKHSTSSESICSRLKLSFPDPNSPGRTPFGEDTDESGDEGSNDGNKAYNQSAATITCNDPIAQELVKEHSTNGWALNTIDALHKAADEAYTSFLGDNTPSTPETSLARQKNATYLDWLKSFLMAHRNLCASHGILISAFAAAIASVITMNGLAYFSHSAANVTTTATVAPVITEAPSIPLVISTLTSITSALSTQVATLEPQANTVLVLPSATTTTPIASSPSDTSISSYALSVTPPRKKEVILKHSIKPPVVCKPGEKPPLLRKPKHIRRRRIVERYKRQASTFVTSVKAPLIETLEQIRKDMGRDIKEAEQMVRKIDLGHRMKDLRKLSDKNGQALIREIHQRLEVIHARVREDGRALNDQIRAEAKYRIGRAKKGKAKLKAKLGFKVPDKKKKCGLRRSVREHWKEYFM